MGPHHVPRVYYAPPIAADPGMSIPTGFPTYRWGWAPQGLGTRRQLAARRLRPGAEPVARIVWRKGKRWADLYVIHHAVPKRTPTPAQLAALDAAMTARRTCPACHRDAGYILPTSWPSCLDCQDHADHQDGRPDGPGRCGAAGRDASRPDPDATPARSGGPANHHHLRAATGVARTSPMGEQL